jgi:hypothetical protein
MPVQRVPRYVLLLQDMHKYTRTNHPDRKNIEEALTFIKTTLTEINRSVSNDDLFNGKKMIEIEKSIDGEFEVQ